MLVSLLVPARWPLSLFGVPLGCCLMQSVGPPLPLLQSLSLCVSVAKIVPLRCCLRIRVGASELVGGASQLCLCALATLSNSCLVVVVLRPRTLWLCARQCQSLWLLLGSLSQCLCATRASLCVPACKCPQKKMRKRPPKEFTFGPEHHAKRQTTLGNKRTLESCPLLVCGSLSLSFSFSLCDALYETPQLHSPKALPKALSNALQWRSPRPIGDRVQHCAQKQPEGALASAPLESGWLLAAPKLEFIRDTHTHTHVLILRPQERKSALQNCCTSALHCSELQSYSAAAQKQKQKEKSRSAPVARGQSAGSRPASSLPACLTPRRVSLLLPCPERPPLLHNGRPAHYFGRRVQHATTATQQQPRNNSTTSLACKLPAQSQRQGPTGGSWPCAALPREKPRSLGPEVVGERLRWTRSGASVWRSCASWLPAGRSPARRHLATRLPSYISERGQTNRQTGVCVRPAGAVHGPSSARMRNGARRRTARRLCVVGRPTGQQCGQSMAVCRQSGGALAFSQ